jgi:hypothetical protein
MAVQFYQTVEENGGGGKNRKKYVVHERYMDGFFEAEKNKRTTQV